jgi:D-3-phosphoglycerate dehydrogenase
MNAPETLVLDLLEWIAVKSRPYGEVMASWRTSCPRLPVWEDAVDFGLVQRCVGEDGETVVELTCAGIERLQARQRVSTRRPTDAKGL